VKSLSSEEHGQLLEEVIGEVKKHDNLYKTVDIKSVIARRDDIPRRKGRWHNFGTMAVMLPSSNTKPWKRKVEKDNFAILSTIITIDRFMAILKSLVEDQVLNVDKYCAFGPYNFGQKEFIGSKDYRRLTNIKWPTNVWRITGKENPRSRAREIVCKIKEWKM